MTLTLQSEIMHCPVLLDEVISGLGAPRGGKFLDCTFGGGGHSAALLQANYNNFVYAIDRDPDAKKRAQEFALIHSNFRFYQMNFADISCLRLPPLDGILMDLGISSFQIEEEGRGFSFKYHAPLDMRMDNSRGMTAAEFLQTATERELVTAIRDYGEEEQWKKIINLIVHHRKTGKLRYSDTFAKVIADNFPKFGRQKIHPATKTFQGIRIFVNDELRALETTLPLLFEKLAVAGRLAVISFHSLEDRIVKRFFNQIAGKAVDRFDDRAQQFRASYATILTKKPIYPNESEIYENPRSRSAKLRILQKERDSL